MLGTNWKQGVPIEVAPFAWAKVFVSESRFVFLSPSGSDILWSSGWVLTAPTTYRLAEDGLREPDAQDGQDEGRSRRY